MEKEGSQRPGKHKILDVDKTQTLSPASASRLGAQFFRRQQQQNLIQA